MKTENQATVADIWRMTIRKMPRAIGPVTFSVGKYEDEWFMDEENFKKSYTQVYVENLDYPDCSEIGTIGIECTENGIIRTY